MSQTSLQPGPTETGGHLLPGVSSGQGCTCFSNVIREKAQESVADAAITFVYPDE